MAEPTQPNQIIPIAQASWKCWDVHKVHDESISSAIKQKASKIKKEITHTHAQIHTHTHAQNNNNNNKEKNVWGFKTKTCP